MCEPEDVRLGGKLHLSGICCFKVKIRVWYRWVLFKFTDGSWVSIGIYAGSCDLRGDVGVILESIHRLIHYNWD